jgi:hypothetical protein
LEFKELFYRDGKRWNFSIDFTRWVFGIEWHRKMGWIELNLGCFTLTFWWKNGNIL